MKVRVLAFARLRELLGPSQEFEVPPGATVDDLWRLLAQTTKELTAMADSTRLARNGKVVDRSQRLSDGDEIALLPPVGGG